MCLSASARPSDRVRLSVGMVCLCLSLVPQVLNLNFGMTSAMVHFVRGLLLGLALVFIASAPRGLRRQPRP